MTVVTNAAVTDTLVEKAIRLNDDIREQVQEELGPFYTKDQEKMVNQKYGVIPPQYTASEKNLIIREERRERGL